MDEFEVEVKNLMDFPWNAIDNISIGNIRRTKSTPDIYYLIKYKKQPFFVVNVYYDYNSVFRGAELLGNYLFVGFCESLFIINLVEKNTQNINMKGYFGELYKYENLILVSSALDLLCFNKDAELLWVSNDLGIDGVIVHNIDGGIIYGSGEFDPPGGWIDFKIKLSSGEKC